MSSNSSHHPIQVEVVPPDPSWREEFESESQQLASVMGDNLVAIHHIGSTAIPGIYAKPVIDLLIEVKDIHQTDAQSEAIAQMGYEVLGEYGLPGRRYFRKYRSPGIRTHHVHTYETGSSEITRHLAFRDYAIAHPEVAQQYSHLKRELAQQYPQDIEAYMDGKDGFIKAIEQKALEWQAMIQNQQDLLTQAYADFNVRNIDAVLAAMHPDVEWANGMEGGYLQGRDAVRDYWIRQWQSIDPKVEPQKFQLDERGRIVVDVHQVVCDLNGNSIDNRMVQHLYTIEDNSIRRMEIK